MPCRAMTSTQNPRPHHRFVPVAASRTADDAMHSAEGRPHLQATPRDTDDGNLSSPFTPHLEALAGHLDNFQVCSLCRKALLHALLVWL